MIAQQNAAVLNDVAVRGFAVGPQAVTHAYKTTERLPFRVKIVTDDEDLWKAVRIRQSAYARHVPEFARQLEEPEAADREAGSIVLLAESHLDGSALGTMRIQTNRYHSLKLEESVELPAWLQDCSLAEATRLGVGEGSIGRVVKTAIFKAYYLYCLEQGIDWMVITARKPLDRQYDMLMFQDVFEAGSLFPMRHVGDIPHRVMSLKTASVKPKWTEADHSLCRYFWDTHHPDIDVQHDDFAAFGGTIRTASRFEELGSRA
jgi:hypothetical protein